MYLMRLDNQQQNVWPKNSFIYRLYIERENDEKGSIQPELIYKITPIKLEKYSDSKIVWILM